MLNPNPKTKVRYHLTFFEISVYVFFWHCERFYFILLEFTIV